MHIKGLFNYNVIHHFKSSYPGGNIMNILYIIGNGFDLWHSLPTKYSDFYKFSTQELDDLEQFLSHISCEDLWNNFEFVLGKYDWSAFYEFYNHIDVTDDSFKPSMAFGLEDELSQETDNLVKWKYRDNSRGKYIFTIFGVNALFTGGKHKKPRHRVEKRDILNGKSQVLQLKTIQNKFTLQNFIINIS